MTTITSRDNPRVKYVCRLAASPAFRVQEGLVFAEGKRLCFDLAATLAPRTVFFTQAFLNNNPSVAGLAPEAVLLADAVAEKIAETKTTQGVFCLYEMPKQGLHLLDASSGLLLCEGLQDPANIGALLRSAAAFGLGGAVLLQGCADPFSPKALRAGMGAAGRIPLATGVSLPEAQLFLRQQGVTLYASALEGGQPLQAVPVSRPFGLLVGGEGPGLSPHALAGANHIVYIPMQRDVESLNAAVAGSVLMYHFKNYTG